MAIDPYRTEGINLETALFVKRQNTVTFENGLVKSVSIQKPSSVLAAVSLPLSVMKAILSVPAELLQLKITNVTDETNLAKAEKDKLDALDALLKAQSSAKSTSPSSAVTGTGGTP
jgi:hypothetical protein